MRWRNGSMLILLAVLLSLSDIAFAAWRSMIPMAVHGRVQSIEVRREKNPGKDDVYLLHLGMTQK